MFFCVDLLAETATCGFLDFLESAIVGPLVRIVRENGINWIIMGSARRGSKRQKKKKKRKRRKKEKQNNELKRIEIFFQENNKYILLVNVKNQCLTIMISSGYK